MWLNDGDKNTKFFHMHFATKKNGHNWIHGSKEISDYFMAQFQELFQSSFSSTSDELEKLRENVITKEENASLIHILSAEEIRVCIGKLHFFKSLGPNGFHGIF